MTYEVKILADSVSPESVRITSMQATFPRFVLAEFNTHCMLGRNSASSRAIPVEKRVSAIQASPFVPAAFGKNQRGMQASENLEEAENAEAQRIWRVLAETSCWGARELAKLNAHKQYANRPTETYAWHTVIVTATDWRNFFALRCSPMAQPEIRTIAEMMRDAMAKSTPVTLCDNQWHLPLVRDVDAPQLAELYRDDRIALVSAARCARVSYLTHDGVRSVDADLELAQRLLHDGHMSPFEHVARPATQIDAIEQLNRMGVLNVRAQPVDEDGDYTGPAIVDMKKFHFAKLRGWVPYRWTIPNEAVFGGGEP